VIVLDASVILDLLLQSGAARAAADRMEGSSWHAPELMDLETLQVLRRYRLHEGLSERRATEALSDFSSLNIRRHRHAPYLNRIWELRDNLTAYDAAYVALAEALRAPLLTRDARLARSRGHGALIELIQ